MYKELIDLSIPKPSAPGAKFSILIPSWNNIEYLKLCIKSIRNNSHFTHQIIVHINEGLDGSLDWIATQQDISYSFSKKNIGVCYALNHAATLATTDYILYLNDDMYVCPDWDKVLVAEIEKIGHTYFFISATAIEPKAQSICSIEKNYGTSYQEFQEERLLKEYKTLSMNDWQGATWPPNVVHKAVWDQVGGYSIEFSPGMYSDPDFSMKLWQIGVREFKGVAESKAYHFRSISVNRVKKNKGYFTFILKWGMTAGTFSKKFLKRGIPYTGTLPDYSLSFLLRIKSVAKQLQAVFYR